MIRNRRSRGSAVAPVGTRNPDAEGANGPAVPVRDAVFRYGSKPRRCERSSADGASVLFGLASGPAGQEVVEEGHPLVGQHALGMELHTVDGKLPVPHSLDNVVLAPGARLEYVGQCAGRQ